MKYETFMHLMRQAADCLINGYNSSEKKLLGIEKYKELNINKELNISKVCVYNDNLTVECTLGECKFKIELKDTRSMLFLVGV